MPGSHRKARDTVIFDASRSDLFPPFHCSHAHCDGRGILEVMALWGDADRFCARAYSREGKQ